MNRNSKINKFLFSFLPMYPYGPKNFVLVVNKCMLNKEHTTNGKIIEIEDT